MNTVKMKSIKWLVNQRSDELSEDLLVSWLRLGQRPAEIDVSQLTEFCDATIVENVFKLKTELDKFSQSQINIAKKTHNSNEWLRSSKYMFGAAVKLEEIDCRLENIFSNPTNRNLDKDLYFADVCGGPGGFSEYLIKESNGRCIGFGITLAGGRKDFRFRHERFERYYGAKNNGDITDPDNIQSFRSFVLQRTENVGLDTVLSDGAFLSKTNMQEFDMKQLYLCQCLVALSTLRCDGSCLIKLFDVYTRFSVGLVYLMYICFKQICIFKPNTSRPASSERYLICKHKLKDTETVRSHLFDINIEMCNVMKHNVDTVEMVSFSVITNNRDFLSYIMESNNEIGSAQIENLGKILNELENKI